MLIGQERLQKHFAELIEQNRFPKLLILVGEKGQGKYTLAQHIAKQIGDIYEPENLKVDDIRTIVEDSQALSRKRVYILRDADEMTNQAQNALLKFAEEPAKNAYIIMTILHENNILPTIESRGSAYSLEPYTMNQLQHFTDDLKLIEMFHTPGQIKTAQQADMKQLEGVIEKVVSSIQKISAANAFNIKNHLADFEIELVLSVILYKYREMLKDPKLYHRIVLNEIRVIYKYKEQLRNKSISKDNALEMMFLELREKALEE